MDPSGAVHAALERRARLVAENVNVGVESLVEPEGPLSMVVCGAAVSTVNAHEAGVGSTFPAVSVARTSKVCAPSVSDAVVSGVVHELQAPPSTRHSNVEPASSAEKVNVGVESFVGPRGRCRSWCSEQRCRP